MVVTATYEDGDTGILTTDDYTTSPANGATLSTQGDVTITVTAGEATDSFVVEVTAPPYPEGLTIVTTPTDNTVYCESYDHGTQPDLTGLTMTLNANGVVRNLTVVAEHSEYSDPNFKMTDPSDESGEKWLFSIAAENESTWSQFGYSWDGSNEYWRTPEVYDEQEGEWVSDYGPHTMVVTCWGGDGEHSDANMGWIWSDEPVTATLVLNFVSGESE